MTCTFSSRQFWLLHALIEIYVPCECPWPARVFQYAVAVTTKAWLEGHRFDLEALARLMPNGDVRVIEQN